MANIVIVTGTITHNSYVRTKELIDSLGIHTTTGIESANATLSFLQTFDLIVCVRTTDDINHSNIVRDAFNSGIPIIVSGASGGSSDDYVYYSVATACAVANRIIRLASTNTFYAFESDAILVDAGITSYPYTFNAYSGVDYAYAIHPSDITSSAKVLVKKTATDNEVFLAYAKRGDADINGQPFPANIAFCGFIYGGNQTYTEIAKSIIGEVIKNTLTNIYITGTVKDKDDNPIERTVRAYRRSDGRMIAEAKSNVNGEYTIYLSDESFYTLMCLDLEDNDKNAIIIDNVKGYKI